MNLTKRPIHVLATALAATALAATTLAACGTSSSGTSAASSASPSASMTHESMSPSPSMSHDAMSPSPSMSHDMMAESPSAAAMMAGAYLDQKTYESQMDKRAGTKVVYFFHAPWCPDCRATDAALLATGVPEGLTVVKVDFDTATELRQKYGVTQQHTFVQVGSDGMQLGKWSGSADGAAILAKTV